MTVPTLPAHPTVRYLLVPDFPGYAVGDDGTVLSCRRPGTGKKYRDQWQALRPARSGRRKYLFVQLWQRGKGRPAYVHHLVLEAFVGPRPAGMVGCHANGDNQDNRLANLRWDTPQANEADKPFSVGKAIPSPLVVRTAIPPLPVVPGVRVVQVAGFPRYCVGSNGAVWSCCNKGSAVGTTDCWEERELVRDTSYLRVSLCHGGKRKLAQVHQLVAEAFLGPRPEGMQVCHGAGGPTDNRVENLSYGTAKDNAWDRDRDGTMPRGSRNGMARLTEDKVRKMRLLHSRTGASVAGLAAKFGVSEGAASKAIYRQTWKHV